MAALAHISRACIAWYVSSDHEREIAIIEFVMASVDDCHAKMQPMLTVSQYVCLGRHKQIDERLARCRRVRVERMIRTWQCSRVVRSGSNLGDWCRSQVDGARGRSTALRLVAAASTGEADQGVGGLNGRA